VATTPHHIHVFGLYFVSNIQTKEPKVQHIVVEYQQRGIVEAPQSGVSDLGGSLLDGRVKA